MNTKVLSVGGSIIAPDKPDVAFLAQFSAMATDWLLTDNDRRLILVAGGGAPARIYQNAYKEVTAQYNEAQKKECTFANVSEANSEADWIGIMATRLNAQLLKASFGDLCQNDVVTNPTADIEWTGKVLVASGWKPGFSSDNDAVLLAEKFGADMVVNLSNIEKVYTDDPRKNPQAKPLDNISWADFRKMVGDEWVPGKNVPFDPVASKKAQSLGLTVICSSGKNIQNTKNILDGSSYIGTTIK